MYHQPMILDRRLDLDLPTYMYMYMYRYVEPAFKSHYHTVVEGIHMYR